MKQHNSKISTLLCLALASVLSASGADRYWAPTSCAIGGAGTWDNTTAQWSPNSTGGDCVAWVNTASDSAFFLGTATYAVAVSGNKTVNRLHRVASGGNANLSGSVTITFAAANSGVDVGAGGYLTLACNYAGVITKTGAGRLEANNSGNSAKWIINAGYVSFAAANRFGSATGSDFLTFDGGGFGIGWSSTGTSKTLASNKGIIVNAGGAFFGASAAANDILIQSPILDGTSGAGNGGLTVTTSSPMVSPYNAGGVVNLQNTTGTANSYKGPTRMYANCTITLGAPDQVPDDSPLEVRGGTFNNGGFSDTVASVLMTSGTMSGAGTITAGSFAFQSGTCGSPLAGSGAVATKTTSGIMSLTAASSFNGGFVHNVGTVRVNNNAALGAASSSVSLADGVTLSTSSTTARTLTYAWTVNGDITLGQTSGGIAAVTMAGTMDLGGANRTFTVVTPEATNTTISAVIGNGGLIKAGAGKLNVTGANNFTGPVNVNEGILAVTVATALGTTDADTTVASGAALQTSGTARIDEAITLNGTGIGGAGALRHTGSAKTLAGAITLGSTGVRINSDSSTLTLSGGVSGSGDVDLTIGGVGSVTISTNSLNLGTGTLTYDGGSATTGLTLSTANTLGALAFNSGRLLLNTEGAAGNGNITVGTGALAISASSGVGYVPVANDVVLAADSAVVLGPASGTPISTLDFTGTISGTAGLIRGRQNNTGAGVVILSGPNTFEGGLRVDSDSLVFGHPQALGPGPFTIGDPEGLGAQVINLAAKTDLTGVNAITNAITLYTNFTWTATNNLEFSGPMTSTNARTITVNGTADAMLSGELSGAEFALTKAGNGTLTLSGANTFEGETVVSEGTLRVYGSIGNGAVTVAGAGILSGSGTVGGAVALNGTVAPGASIGELTTGAQTWNGGGKYEWEVGNTTGTAGVDWDRLVVTGDIDVQATAESKFTIKVAGDIANFDKDTNYEWSGLVAPSGAVLNFDAAKFAAEYSAVVNDLAGGDFTVAEDGVKVKFMKNNPPSASNRNVQRVQGVALKINVADLLANNSSDPDDDARALVDAGVDTAPGKGTVSVSGGYVLYQPTDVNSTDSDSFSFKVRDVRSAYRDGDTVRTAVALINVSVVSATGGAAQTIDTSGGEVSVKFAGIPGYPYAVERAEDVNFTVNLTTVLTTNAPAAGVFGITDSNPPSPQAYYRLRYNP